MQGYIAASPTTWRAQTQQTPSSLILVSSTFTQEGRGVYRLGLHTMSILFLYSLRFLESPVVTVALSDILVAVGEAAVLACAASGTPQPEIWWYKGGPSNC